MVLYYETKNELYHYGVKGQKWGVRRSKEELKRHRLARISFNESIQTGKVHTKIKVESQNRHLKNHRDYVAGRSYINGDIDTAQKLIYELSGTGSPIPDRNGRWTNKERVRARKIIGVHIDPITGIETPTHNAFIIYSKSGTHIVPRKDD